MANAVNGKDKIRILFQSDRELAEAAVGEILRYYRVRARIIPEGMEDYEEILEYLLRPSGILRRRVRLTEGWYKDAAGAMLGSKKDGTMVALIPGKLRGYTIVDPASGKNEVVNARTAAELDTDAVCFYKPFPLKAIGVKDVIFHVISLLRTRDYAWMIGLTAVITLIQTIGPKITLKIYSPEFLGTGSHLLLISMILVLTLSEVSKILFSLAKNLISQNIQDQLGFRLRARR